jgi:tRNA threonylcarbamoyladenosine biosynthesis protein TsaE
MEKYTTNNSKQTQKMGELLAKELRGGEIICLTGDLGSGKTTFAQGILKGLGLKGAFVSPTFMIMKEYDISCSIEHRAYNKKQKTKMFHVPCSMFHNVYHIDAYRVKAKDILDLGWKEIIADSQNIVIIEWAERVKRIMPKDAVWMKFEWVDENEREIIISSKLKVQSTKL